MRSAPQPLNEWDRLENLRHYDLLDSSADPALDILTELASLICEMPVALISLIDSHRQWFMSRVGLTSQQTPRELAFCAHAILDDQIFEVQDSRIDERFHDNPLVSSAPNVIYYSGVPLKTPEGFNIGTLCVIDHKPNALSAEKRKALRLLGTLTMEQIVARKNRTSLEQRISDISKLQNEMTQHQSVVFQNSKLSSLGEVASGMAHEINNPLTVIKGRLMMIRSQVESQSGNTQPKVDANFEIIDHAIDRISDIISQLKSFARDGSNDPMKIATIKEIMDSTMMLCSGQLKEFGIELLLNISDEAIKLNCRKTQISQALINLISNSADAVKSLDNKWIELKVEKSGSFIEFHVIDSGSGIPLVIQDHLMQPFFTTKAVGQGTGLGLSISKGIAESHGGTLTLENESKNTHFVFKVLAASKKIQQ